MNKKIRKRARTLQFFKRSFPSNFESELRKLFLHRNPRPCRGILGIEKGKACQPVSRYLRQKKKRPNGKKFKPSSSGLRFLGGGGKGLWTPNFLGKKKEILSFSLRQSERKSKILVEKILQDKTCLFERKEVLGPLDRTKHPLFIGNSPLFCRGTKRLEEFFPKKDKAPFWKKVLFRSWSRGQNFREENSPKAVSFKRKRGTFFFKLLGRRSNTGVSFLYRNWILVQTKELFRVASVDDRKKISLSFFFFCTPVYFNAEKGRGFDFLDKILFQVLVRKTFSWIEKGLLRKSMNFGTVLTREELWFFHWEERGVDLLEKQEHEVFGNFEVSFWEKGPSELKQKE